VICEIEQLAPADAAKLKTLAKRYLDQRISFYTIRSQARAAAPFAWPP
jgi:hypothetical protein